MLRHGLWRRRMMWANGIVAPFFMRVSRSVTVQLHGKVEMPREEALGGLENARLPGCRLTFYLDPSARISGISAVRRHYGVVCKTDVEIRGDERQRPDTVVVVSKQKIARGIRRRKCALVQQQHRIIISCGDLDDVRGIRRHSETKPSVVILVRRASAGR